MRRYLCSACFLSYGATPAAAACCEADVIKKDVAPMPDLDEDQEHVPDLVELLSTTRDEDSLAEAFENRYNPEASGLAG